MHQLDDWEEEMRYKKRMITALKPDGTEFTGTYEQWREITGDSVLAIQKRMSVRARQLREGKKPYSMDEVTGTVKLKGEKRVPVRKPKPSQAMSRLNRSILFRKSQMVLDALNSMELNYGDNNV